MDNLERDMTRDEITRATELARACMASDYQNCERPAQSSTASPRRMTAARAWRCVKTYSTPWPWFAVTGPYWRGVKKD